MIFLELVVFLYIWHTCKIVYIDLCVSFSMILSREDVIQFYLEINIEMK